MAGFTKGRVDQGAADGFTGSPGKGMAWAIARKKVYEGQKPAKEVTEQGGTKVKAPMSQKPADRKIYQELNPESGEFEKEQE